MLYQWHLFDGFVYDHNDNDISNGWTSHLLFFAHVPIKEFLPCFWSKWVQQGIESNVSLLVFTCIISHEKEKPLQLDNTAKPSLLLDRFCSKMTNQHTEGVNCKGGLAV